MNLMGMEHSSQRAQSAMEYLMTYGWAVAIISVVLVIMFSLNLFNASAAIGTGSCVAQPGYSCTALFMSQAAVLSFTFSQDLGVTAYNAQFACFTAASSSPTQLQYTAQAEGGGSTGTISSSGAAGIQSANIPILSGFTVNGVQCSVPGGATFLPFGTSLTGRLWMAYTTNSFQPDNIYIQIASFSAKSSS